jgi:signal peptidase II
MKEAEPSSNIVQTSGRSTCELRWIGIGIAAALVVLLIDQLTKHLVMHHYRLYESTPVISNIFSITYVRNSGAAWNILAGKQYLLLIFAILVLVGICRFFRYLSEGYPERIVALMLMISGIIGNSIDRLWHNEVIDFLDFHYYDIWSYPVFNVADMSICIGAGLFVLSSCLRKKPQEKQP